tara:strand:+ start:271 stop:450 length:180 start_codon:yes stop_codon:yes gene_type:complete
MKQENHIGYPLPSEMFNTIPTSDKFESIDAEFDKHVKITKLLDIPLKCPHCKEILKRHA